MKIDSAFFKTPNFESFINDISFQNTKVTGGAIGNRSIPALIIVLENGLELKLVRYISYTDYDPCYYTAIRGKDIDIIDSEWSENFGKDINIKWKEDTSKKSSLADLVGKKVLNIEHYSWDTLIDFEENLFIKISNKKSYDINQKFLKPFTLSIGVWINRENNSAEKLGQIELNS